MQGADSSNVWLLCDLGNSSIKVALGTGPRPVCEHIEWLLTWPHRKSTQPETWWPLWRALEARGVRPQHVALSSVAQPEVRDSLLEALHSEGFTGVVWNPDSGLELLIRHPETAGLDRLYAARAGFEGFGKRAAIVVDAGTALTVDAVRPGEEPDRGAFLGGAIAPGPELLAQALAAGGAQLHAIQPKPHHKALGRETREALTAGVVVGFEGAAVRLVQRMLVEAEMPEPFVVLTGGASLYLDRAFAQAGWECMEEPNLVLFGLWLAAVEASG
jgi:type III pantothenate kinase